VATTADHEEFDGAKVALFVGDRLLIIRRDDRPDIPYPDYWDFPGGGREGLETPFETVARETAEEVGLVLSLKAVIWKRAFTRSSGAARVWFFVAQLPTAAATQIVFGNEGQGWQLASAKEVLTLPKVVGGLQQRLALWLAEDAACDPAPAVRSD